VEGLPRGDASPPRNPTRSDLPERGVAAGHIRPHRDDVADCARPLTTNAQASRNRALSGGGGGIRTHGTLASAYPGHRDHSDRHIVIAPFCEQEGEQGSVPPSPTRGVWLTASGHLPTRPRQTTLIGTLGPRGIAGILPLGLRSQTTGGGNRLGIAAAHRFMKPLRRTRPGRSWTRRCGVLRHREPHARLERSTPTG